MSDKKLIGSLIAVAVLLLGIGGTVAFRMAGRSPNVEAPPQSQVAAQISPVPKQEATAQKREAPTADPAKRNVIAQAKPPTPVQQQAVAAPKGDAKFAGFRDIKWGTDLRLLTDDFFPADDQSETATVQLDGGNSLTIKNQNIVGYKRKYGKLAYGKLTFGTVHVNHITYEAFDGKFYELSIDCSGSFADLKTVFTEYYGQSRDWTAGGTEYSSWEGIAPDGNHVNITMFQSPRPPNYLAMAHITNVELEKQLHEVQVQQAKSQLNKVKQDF